MTNSNKKLTLAKIQLIFKDIFLDDSLVITENTSPLDIEEWDSLAHINILSAIETEFDIHFTAEDMSDIKNISTLLYTIEMRKS